METMQKTRLHRWHNLFAEYIVPVFRDSLFKFIRIDYMRRLTYTDGLSSSQRNGIRFTFRLTL